MKILIVTIGTRGDVQPYLARDFFGEVKSTAELGQKIQAEEGVAAVPLIESPMREKRGD